jgi:hypothetical protein
VQPSKDGNDHGGSGATAGSRSTASLSPSSLVFILVYKRIPSIGGCKKGDKFMTIGSLQNSYDIPSLYIIGHCILATMHTPFIQILAPQESSKAFHLSIQIHNVKLWSIPSSMTIVIFNPIIHFHNPVVQF